MEFHQSPVHTGDYTLLATITGDYSRRFWSPNMGFRRED